MTTSFERDYQNMSVFEKQCLGFLRDIALANMILVFISVIGLGLALWKTIV